MGKKPVIATVTAEDKTYDGDNRATVRTKVETGVLPGDEITITGLTGTFNDENAGKDRMVTVVIPNPEQITGKNSEHYAVTYSSTIVTADINKAIATVTEPARVTLTYTGSPQNLINGAAVNPANKRIEVEYALNENGPYSTGIPEGTNAGNYTVWYRAQETQNYTGEPAKKIDVTIGKKSVTPTLTLDTLSYTYDGTEKKPGVTLFYTADADDNSAVGIPADQYTVSYSDNVNVGTATVTVTAKAGGNYEFTGSVEGTFTIAASSQSPLSIVTSIPTNVHYGDSFTLSAIGGSGNGKVKWSSNNEGVATVDNNGRVTVKSTGDFTISAYRMGESGYSDSNTESLPFHADPKPITAVATAENRGYNGGVIADVKVTVPELNQTITVTGTFDDANVGTNKTVTIAYGEGTKVEDSNYQITWPATTTASIYMVDAAIETAPKAHPGTDNQGLTYTGQPQDLLTDGKTVGNIGTIVYSTGQYGAYSTNIPRGTAAGTYTVWYKVADSVNYTGIPAAEVKVEGADHQYTSHGIRY